MCRGHVPGDMSLQARSGLGDTSFWGGMDTLPGDMSLRGAYMARGHSTLVATHPGGTQVPCTHTHVPHLGMPVQGDPCTHMSPHHHPGPCPHQAATLPCPKLLSSNWEPVCNG